MFQQPIESLYAAFDRYPAPKGAATHIGHMAGTLFSVVDHGGLFCIGGGELPAYQKETSPASIEIVRFTQQIPNFLDRTLAFGEQLYHCTSAQRASLELVHFRDPWSGIPIIDAIDANTPVVYEINGLPSVELGYHYPNISSQTREKIRLLEKRCIERADSIIVPSPVIARNMVAQGVSEKRISVLQNGADIIKPAPANDSPSPYILYFGAAQPWQGIPDLLRAFAINEGLWDTRLVLCLSKKSRLTKQLQKFANKLGILDKIDWHYGLPQDKLRPLIRDASFSVAPLTECSRNVSQGCCPLKILESMGAGVPVIASDLDVTRSIINDGVNGRLVRPNRPSDLARAMLLMQLNIEERNQMAKAAQHHIQQHFSWAQITKSLAALYHSMLNSSHTPIFDPQKLGAQA